MFMYVVRGYSNGTGAEVLSVIKNCDRLIERAGAGLVSLLSLRFADVIAN